MINYKMKLSRICAILQPWQSKNLTIYGKATLINSLVVSQFTYLMSALPSPPDLFFKEYEQEIFKFMWTGKKDQVRRAYL